MSQNLDKLLAEWPMTERSEAEWDDMAEETVGRAKLASRTVSVALQKSKDEATSGHEFLAAPLPVEAGEPSSPHLSARKPSEGVMSQSSFTSDASKSAERSVRAPEGGTMNQSAESKMSKERSKRGSFSDLAKLAGSPTPTPPPVGAEPIVRAKEASGEDSGIVDFKMLAAMADPGAEERAKTAPLADEGLFDDDKPAKSAPAAAAVSSPPPSSSSSSAVSSAAAAPAAATAPAAAKKDEANAAAAAIPFPEKSKDKSVKNKESSGIGVILFLGVAGVAAVAAGAYFYVKSQQPPPLVSNNTPAVDVAPKKTEAKKTEEAPQQVQADDTAGVEPATTTATANKPVVKHGTTGKVAAATAPTVDPKLSVKTEDLGTQQNAGGTGLSEAMKNVVGPLDTAKPQDTQPAAGGQMGNVPQKPSQGQVQGAVNAVLAEARGCLGPDDPVSKASVVFQSDGSVQTVTVTGNAAGKPAEACIKGALSKAKVQPFAEPTFSFPVTVRPNS